MEEKYLTVTQINNYINRKLKGDDILKNVYIRGELSNYKTYPSGHSYFTLKDIKFDFVNFLKFLSEMILKI